MSVLRSLLLALPLLACARAEFHAPEGAGGGKADGWTAPVIELREDWTVVVSGQLVAGEDVIVRYDLDRVTECRSQQGGQEAWTVTGFAMVDGSEPAPFTAARLATGAVVAVDATLSLPRAARTLTLFFQASDVFGCRAWDSNFGANYVFPLSPAPDRPVSAVLTFHPDGQVTQDGAVEANTRVLIQYDPARLAVCAGSQGDLPQWAITGHATVDRLNPTSFRAAEPDGADLAPTDTLLDVGDGDTLELWFEATSATGCNQFDSNFGNNFRFPIE